MSLEAVQTDTEGYLSNRDDWSEDLANELAQSLGIELTDEHWKVLNTARAIETESGSSPGLRKISKRSETPIKSIYKPPCSSPYWNPILRNWSTAWIP